MSRDLMDALAREAAHGAALYDARADVDDAVVAPARRRVRRARRTEAVGALALSAAVVVGGVLAVDAWRPAEEAPIAPAQPQETAPAAPTGWLTADSVEVVAPRERDVPGEAGWQEAMLCDNAPRVEEPGEAEGPSLTFTECEAVWLDRTLLELSAAGVRAEGDGGLAVEWLLRNVSGQDMEYNASGVTTAVVADLDGAAPDPLVTHNGVVSESLWASGSARLAAVTNLATASMLAADSRTGGSTAFGAAELAAAGYQPLVDGVAAGTVTPTVTLQVHLPVLDVDGRELWVELESDPSAAADAPPALPEDVFADLAPRTRGQVRWDAQPALDCRVPAGENPRAGAAAPAAAPDCEAVWIPGERPLVSIGQVDFLVNEVEGTTTVTWRVRNDTDGTLSLDQAGSAMTLETDPDATASAPPTDVAAGPLVAATRWTSDTTRWGFLSEESDVVLVAPGTTVGGEAVFEGTEQPSGLFSVLIRVARADDGDYSRELLLELSWEG